MMHATFDNWIRHESTPFSVDSSETFNASIDRVIASLDDSVELLGIGHGFGRLEANRELVVWMRRYNADPTHMVKLRFYGFDIPGLAAGIASPAQVLHFVRLRRRTSLQSCEHAVPN